MSAGEVFGPYRLESLLGRGGMGEVWRAVDTGHGGRPVAIKLLGAWLGGDAEFAARFRRECALAAKVSGPHVIDVRRYGEIDGRLYIEMPLVQGRDLGSLLGDGPLSPERAVRIVEQVADALDTAHAAGLVHRDVKPSNVLVTPRDFAYLIDFGIARAVDGTRFSQSGALVGTYAYMAPERFEGVADHRSDVYALGCVLFEALTGRVPFEASSLPAYMKAHVSEEPPRPSAIDAVVPIRLDAVVARAMSKRPEERFESAGALAAAALAAIRSPARERQADVAVAVSHPPLAPEPTASVPAAEGAVPVRTSPRDGIHLSLPAGLTRPARLSDVEQATGSSGPARATGHEDVAMPERRGPSRRMVLGLAGAALLATAVPVGYLALRSSADERLFTAHTGAVLGLAVADLDGRPVVVSGGEDGTLRIGELSTGSMIGQPLTGHQGPVRAVASPAGRPILVSGGEDSTIRIWDLVSGELRKTATGHTGPVYAVSIGSYALGTSAVSGAADATVRVWDLMSGAALAQPFRGHHFLVGAVAASGSMVISGSRDGTLRIWELGAETVRPPLSGHGGYVNALAPTSVNGRRVVVSGSEDQTLRIWDLDSAAPVGNPLTGHTEAVRAVTVAQVEGEPMIVSGGADGTVRIWDPVSGSAVGEPFLGHTGPVNALAVATLGGRPVVVSGGADGSVRTWDLRARLGL